MHTGLRFSCAPEVEEFTCDSYRASFTRPLCGFSLDSFEFFDAVLHVDDNRVSRKLTSDGLLDTPQAANSDGWRGLSDLNFRGS